MSVIKSCYLMFLLGMLIYVQAQDPEEGSKQFIDHPDKNEYILAQPGTDKHKYGYELKENKHFHHTTTELDGVRLGCYGYVLNGKKYSTQYVADIKGYRPVYTYNVIEVFPKSGGTREASFIRNFEESEDRSGNLRYFFPEGCRGFDSEISPEKNPMTPLIFDKSTTFGNIPKTPIVPNVPKPNPPQPPQQPQRQTPPRISPPPNNPPPSQKPPSKYLPPPPKYLPPGQQPAQPPQQPQGKYVTKAPAPAPKANPIVPKTNYPQVSKASPPFQNRVPATSPAKNNNGCVDEDSVPKIVIPIKLKNNGRSESCSSYAKLIVPADSVSVNSLKSNPTELAKMVLESLT